MHPDGRLAERPVSSNRSLLRPALVVTLCVALGQVVGAVTQMVIAAAFGAGADLDSYLIATTLPQFVIAVLMTALSFVLIPTFVEYSVAGHESDAWKTANSVITLCMLLLALLALMGMLSAKFHVRLVAPGSSSDSLCLAAKIAVVLWPTVLLTGAVNLLSSLYQAKNRFTWPAIVAALGSAANLVLILILTRTTLGIESLAVSLLLSLVLQVVLLTPVLSGRFHPRIDWGDPGLRRIVSLLWPLICSSLVARFTPVLERYLASDMGAGTISQLGYAYKIVVLLAALISTGMGTVIFPTMASTVAKNDMAGLRRAVSQGFRMMWLGIAPVVAIGFALALPITVVLFRRGAFSQADAAAVSRLLQAYLLSLIGMSLGSITGRTFYALKRTRLIAVMGGVSTLTYFGYAPLFARHWGALGIALACVVLFNLDVIVNTVVIRAMTGKPRGTALMVSFVKTGLAAVVGGCAAWGISRLVANVWAQMVFGGVGGLAAYGGTLMIARSTELKTLAVILLDKVGSRSA